MNWLNKYYLQLSLFIVFFFNIIFIYLFYNWIIKWVYEFYFEFKYSQIHYFSDSIITFSDVLKYVLIKLDNINIYSDVIDYIIVTRYIDIQLGGYYSYQFFYTFCFLCLDIDSNIIPFMDTMLGVY